MASNKVLALFLAASLLVLGPVAAAAQAPGKCGVSTASLGACTSALRPVFRAKVAASPVQPCCSLVNGLANAEAAACLCSAVRAAVVSIRGSPVNFPLYFGFVLNNCGRRAPGFTC
ncbi:unnamed protein product [Urochloa humidicola]